MNGHPSPPRILLPAAASAAAPPSRPLLLCPVAAGWPSPAEDYIEGTLNLHEHLVRNGPATFFVKAGGDSMIGAGIHEGDLLVVDRSLASRPGRVVIACLEGEFTVKRLEKRGKRLFLVPENPAYEAIDITEREDVAIWGVVTNVIHPL